MDSESSIGDGQKSSKRRMCSLPFTVFLSTVYCLLSTVYCSAAQGARIIGQTATPSRITVGDPVDYQITLEVSEGTRVVVLPVATDDDNLEIASPSIQTREIPDSRDVRVDARFSVRIFSPGNHTIPAIQFQVIASDDSENIVSADPFPIRVDSVLPADAQDILDIKPPQSLRSSRWIYWMLAVGLLTAAAVILGLVYWRRRHQVEPSPEPPPPRPAHVVALEALKRLEDSDLLAQNRVQEFFVRLSEILRQYIEQRYQIPALELTTKELIIALEPCIPTREVKRILINCLEMCDLVKFARYLPLKPEAHAQLARSQEFVQQTRSRNQFPPSEKLLP